jgi:hypothetical protein
VIGEVAKGSRTMSGGEIWVRASSGCPNVSVGSVVGLHGVVGPSKPQDGMNGVVGTPHRS